MVTTLHVSFNNSGNDINKTGVIILGMHGDVMGISWDIIYN
jgi:hypothetical protein